MGSKEVTLLTRLLTNGGRDHGGRGTTARLVAQALQAAQEAARCGLPPRPLSGRGPHFSARDGPGALSGCSGRVVTTPPPSRATVPPPQHARDASGSSTRLWHACECCDVSGCLYMICVARSWSDVLIGHRQCYYSTPYTRNRQCMMCELQYLFNRGHLGTFRQRFPRKNDRKRGSFWPRYGHFSGCGMRP